jgi:hypothetical protein
MNPIYNRAQLIAPLLVRPRPALRQNGPKPTKAHENEIAFVCFLLFFGNGTFQWVAADSNKKIRACLRFL